jgi:hypothetical protein
MMLASGRFCGSFSRSCVMRSFASLEISSHSGVGNSSEVMPFSGSKGGYPHSLRREGKGEGAVAQDVHDDADGVKIDRLPVALLFVEHFRR